MTNEAQQPTASSIAMMKTDELRDALTMVIPILSDLGEPLDKLVPVGPRPLKDATSVIAICDWHRRLMRIFTTQFESTVERTAGYLRDLSIDQPERLFHAYPVDTPRHYQ